MSFFSPQGSPTHYEHPPRALTDRGGQTSDMCRQVIIGGRAVPAEILRLQHVDPPQKCKYRVFPVLRLHPPI
jgi:hypothetical protein